MALDAAELWQRGRRRRVLIRSAGPAALVAMSLVVVLGWPSGRPHAAPPVLTVTPTPSSSPEPSRSPSPSTSTSPPSADHRCRPEDARTEGAPCGATYLDTTVAGEPARVELDEHGLWVKTPSRFLFDGDIRAGGDLRIAGVTDLVGDGHKEVLVAGTSGGCCDYRVTDAVMQIVRIDSDRLTPIAGSLTANHGRGDQYAGWQCGKGGLSVVTGHRSTGPSGGTFTVTSAVIDGTTLRMNAPGAGHDDTSEDLAEAADVRGCPGLGSDGFVPADPAVSSAPDCRVGGDACSETYDIVRIAGAVRYVEVRPDSVTVYESDGLKAVSVDGFRTEASIRLAGVTTMFGHQVALVATGTPVPGHYALKNATFVPWVVDASSLGSLDSPDEASTLRTGSGHGFTCVGDTVRVASRSDAFAGPIDASRWSHVLLADRGASALQATPEPDFTLEGPEGVSGCPGLGPDGFVADR